METEKITAVLQSVTDHMLTLKNNEIYEKFPISLIDINCWEWPQGIGIFGLYKRYARCGDKQLLQFLIDWYDARLAEGLPEKNVNTTSPMLTLTYLYEITQNPVYWALIEEWAKWIMRPDGLIKTPDGCFQHMITGDPNDNEILIDTLFMTLLFLVRAGKLLNRQDYVDEANFQILNHIKYLYDKTNQIFYHGWNFSRNDNYGKVHWARGNAWYTIGLMELLEMQPDMDPAIQKYLIHIFRQQASSLRQLQDMQSGQWYTVLDDSSSYIEISASAGFLCGIMKGVRMGVLPKEAYLELIQKGSTGILNYISANGSVQQVSYGTPIGQDVDFYKNIICCTMTYGQALMILLLEEMLQEYWRFSL